MANTNTEDLSNYNLNKPVIRTMESDLRSLKAGLSPDLLPKDALKTAAKSPVNLPVDFSRPAPKPPVSWGAASAPAAPQPRFSDEETNSLRPPVTMPRNRTPDVRAPQPQKEAVIPPVVAPEPVAEEKPGRQTVESPVNLPVGDIPSESAERPAAEEVGRSYPQQERAAVEPVIEPPTMKRTSRPSFVPSFIPPSNEVRPVSRVAPVAPKEESLPPVVPPKRMAPVVEPPKKMEPVEPPKKMAPVIPLAELPIKRTPRPSFAPSFIPPENQARPVSRVAQRAVPAEENLPPEARLAMQSSSTDFTFAQEIEKIGSQRRVMPSDNQSYKFSDGSDIKSGSLLGKILKGIITLVLLAGIAYGIYYFGLLKGPDASRTEAAGELLVPVSEILEIKTNLNADVTQGVKSRFTSETVPVPSGVYRIIVRDKSGSKILAKEDFKKALNIDIPVGVSSSLEKDYNLLAFNYPDKKYLRLGFVFKIKNEKTLLSSLIPWEPSMFASTRQMFLGAPAFSTSSGLFKDNAYKEAKIRYMPLGSNNSVLNYAIDKNKKYFFIATSGEDIFYMIDNIGK